MVTNPMLSRLTKTSFADAAREIALGCLRGEYGYTGTDMMVALNNVEMLTGIYCDAFMDDRENESDRMNFAAFACAGVSIHDDVNAVPRYSNILYLGTPASSGAVHRLHVVPKVVGWVKIREWIEKGSIPHANMKSVQTMVLEQGMVVELDGHCPHWLTVELDGVEIGSAIDPLFDGGNLSTNFCGVNPEDVVGIFAAFAMDVPVSDDILLKAFSSMKVRQKHHVCQGTFLP